MEQEQKNSKGLACGCVFFVIILIVVGAIIVWQVSTNKKTNNSGSTGSQITEVFDKTLKSHHFQLVATDQGINSVTITVTALTNIDYIDVYIEFLDENELIVCAKTERITNLPKDLSQSVTFNLSFSELLSATQYKCTARGKIK